MLINIPAARAVLSHAIAQGQRRGNFIGGHMQGCLDSLARIHYIYAGQVHAIVFYRPNLWSFFAKA
jgi:hypothetical protein